MCPGLATASISACANASAWKEALAVFESIKEKDVVTYNSSITACTKGRQAGRSLRLFSEMKALQLRPDQVTHGAVLNACEKAALWVEALHLLAQEPPPTIVLVNMVASACEKGHQWQQALAVLQAAKRHRLRADSTTLNAAMAACLRGEEWSRSLEFFHRMQRGRGPTLHSYAEALSSLHQAQRWEDALRLFAEVSHQSDRHVLGAAFRAAALCWPEALLLLDRHDDKLDAVCILLSLAALDQAGQGWVRTTLVERLTKEIVSSLNPGDLTAAVATAVHGVTSVDRGVTPQVLHQASRALWQVVYAPTLRHLGRPGVGHYFDPKISTEWSSLELASRDALVLLDLAAQSRGQETRPGSDRGGKAEAMSVACGERIDPVGPAVSESGECETKGFGLAFLGHEVLLTDIGEEQAAATQGNIAQNQATLNAVGGRAQYGHLDWRTSGSPALLSSADGVDEDERCHRNTLALPERSRYGRFDMAVAWATSGPGAEEVILSHKERGHGAFWLPSNPRVLAHENLWHSLRKNKVEPQLGVVKKVQAETHEQPSFDGRYHLQRATTTPGAK
ncbi:Pentatricopeptide repeat-containing protein At1g09900 [Durusdinium trenchii]|uniref:Pentatricopeptide repeat-containing protein At1g09900 n=1 Tax=Durusdinium trenchii TaxID=1381693 RepID=A0ABP0IE68_9DINO